LALVDALNHNKLLGASVDLDSIPDQYKIPDAKLLNSSH